MVAVLLVGYQQNEWIARFPFGHHWGDRGYGYIPIDYFNRYNRDRWLIVVERCGNVEGDDPEDQSLGLHLDARLDPVAPHHHPPTQASRYDGVVNPTRHARAPSACTAAQRRMRVI